MMKEKLDLSLVLKLTKFRRTKQLRQGVADRYPRNKPCPCGSKKKYKHCCWSKGNAPGNSFQSEEFFKEFEKKIVYSQKRAKTNDNSSALQEE